MNLLTPCLTFLPRPRCTTPSTHSHPYSAPLLTTSTARLTQPFHPFIYFTGKLWKSLPVSVFPSSHDCNSFKRGVSRHVQNWTELSFSEHSNVAIFFNIYTFVLPFAVTHWKKNIDWFSISEKVHAHLCKNKSFLFSSAMISFIISRNI